MKIAIDIKGTLEGHKRSQILKIMGELQRAGHELVLWSNEFSFALEAARKLCETPFEGIIATYKRSKAEVSFDESEYYDIAIEDDRSQGEWLAAKRFMFVDEIPTDTPVSFLKEFLGRQS